MGSPGHAAPVLIVEDNDLNMRLFEDVLQAHGFATIASMTGLDVLELARQHHPFVIIMDLQLPTISGLDVICELRKTEDLCAIPVIAVTAWALPGTEEKIRNAGGNDYMTKPISITKFVQAVQKYKF